LTPIFIVLTNLSASYSAYAPLENSYWAFLENLERCAILAIMPVMG
jgi:hypothetical protein